MAFRSILRAQKQNNAAVTVTFSAADCNEIVNLRQLRQVPSWSDACQGCFVALPKLPPNARGFLQTLMIVDIHKPDTSTLVTTGHFYFGWTNSPARIANLAALGLNSPGIKFDFDEVPPQLETERSPSGS